MTELDMTRDRLGVLRQQEPPCYILVHPMGPTKKWGFTWAVDLSDLVLWRGRELDELFTVAEGLGDSREWFDEVEIEWAPDREIEVAAARQLFPRSSLAKVVVGRPGGTYSAEWSRFLES